MRSPANHQAPSNYRLPREKDPTVARNFARLIEYSILYSIPRTLIEIWHLPSRNSLLLDFFTCWYVAMFSPSFSDEIWRTAQDLRDSDQWGWLCAKRVPTLRHQVLIILRLEKGLHQPLTPLTTRWKLSIVLLTFNICRKWLEEHHFSYSSLYCLQSSSM